MTTGIFKVLDIGKYALFTEQRAIHTTGHNIANANTDGYSRQRVNMETNEPMSSWPGQLGMGVRAQEVERIHDRFLGGRIISENEKTGKWEAKKEGLERIETVLNESDDAGLSLAMSEFWNAWHDLSLNPSGEAERVVLLSKGENLSRIINNIYSELELVRKDMDGVISGSLSEINSITNEIADLNLKIFQVESSRQNANDYRDKRDLLLKELSYLIDIDTFEDNQGKVTVLLKSGTPLVSDISPWTLSSEQNGEGLTDVVWIDFDGNTNSITDAISGGKLGGWLDVRDEVIPDYLNKLDELASTLIGEVNAIHSSGYALDGSTGNDFFAGSSASDIEVSQSICNNTSLIAAAEELEGIPGDNRNAIAIAQLQNILTMNEGTITFDEYYNSLVSDVGDKVTTSTRSLEHQDTVMNQLDTYRETVSGVSLDEEMVNLVKYQHAFDAAAKLITTVDEMLETVIAMAH
jgi:flagellar hook-associated protein 1 FlgK